MIDFVCPVKIDDIDRLKLLDQSINTLVENTPSEYINRIILIDDMSTLDFSYEGIEVIRNEFQRGVGGSKNFGVKRHYKLGRGKYLYIFDGDVYFTEGWAEKMISAYKDHGSQYKIIAGGVHPFLQPRNGEDNEVLTSHDAISGWSWLLSYGVWDKYGVLASNSLGTGKSEDTEYCLRVRDDGYYVGCLKDQVIAHCGLTNTEGEKIVGHDVSKALCERVAPRGDYL